MRLVIIGLPSLLLLTTALVMDRPHNPPLQKEHTIQAAVPVPPKVDALLRRACFDCHSSETRWPWYSAVPPVSHFIRKDVEAGRAALNFSEWSTEAGANPRQATGLLRAACAAAEAHLMPKAPYPYLHPEARLSGEDVKQLCEWTRETVARILAGEEH